VSIQDNGVGIAPDHHTQIFQPFYTTKPAVKGTGLGLSICHGIVRNHQGEIRVESEPGKGSTFTILLPVAGKEDPDAAAAAAGPAKTGSTAARQAAHALWSPSPDLS
jgi:K+-sensing histidine kinase KdpD